jgi:hypothetical protein
MKAGIAARQVRRAADTAGGAAALLCALHCLILPGLLVTGTAVPVAVWGTEMFHRLMLGVVAPSAMIAFAMGCRQHRDAATVSLGVCGLIALAAAALGDHVALRAGGERLVTLAGSAALGSAHFRNYQLCRRADHACARTEEACGAGDAQ